jgi:hypothetical protein
MKVLHSLGDEAAGPGSASQASVVAGALRELSVGLIRGNFLLRYHHTPVFLVSGAAAPARAVAHNSFSCLYEYGSTVLLSSLWRPVMEGASRSAIHTFGTYVSSGPSAQFLVYVFVVYTLSCSQFTPNSRAESSRLPSDIASASPCLPPMLPTCDAAAGPRPGRPRCATTSCHVEFCVVLCIGRALPPHSSPARRRAGSFARNQEKVLWEISRTC